MIADPSIVAMQVLRIQELQRKLAEATAALQQERDRAALLTQELDRLRLTSASAATSPCLPSSPISAHRDGDGDEGEDLVLVPRATLELLYLKERAMDAVKEGITIAEANQPDMPLIYVNEGFARITGYPTEFARGRNCRFLQGEGTDPETVNTLRNAIAAGQPCVVQITNYKRSGDPFINYLSLTPVHDASGALTHYVGVQSDLTEMVQQRQAELAAKHAAVQASAATEAKSQFLARMSHEIRTPLNGMIAVGQLLADTKLTSTQWDLVNTIRCSGEALLTLITDILDFSKIEANKMVLAKAPFLLESTIEAAMEIAGLHAARKRLQVAYHVTPGVPRWVVGDPQRLQQILLNILNNALKFTDAGEVLLEVWAQPIKGAEQQHALPTATAGSEGIAAPRLAAQHQECEVHFSVRDTGIGIQPRDLARLFQSFSQVDASHTRRFGGSGLGLTISQKLAEAMGGRMWAESDGLGQGSTFRWCIRTESGTPTQPERRRSRDDGVLRGKKVLLVESCAIVREVMMVALRRWGCQVCAVDSEKVALTKLKRGTGTAAAVTATALMAAAQTTEIAAQAPGSAKAPSTPSPTGSEGSASPGAIAAAAAAALPSAAGAVGSRCPSLALASTAAEELSAAHTVSKACSGPYDVVILDVDHTAVLRCLLDACAPDEARRVVFLGWPGQQNPEDQGSPTRDGDGSPLSGSGSPTNHPSTGSLPEEMPPPAYATSASPLVTAPQPPSEVVANGRDGGRDVPGRRQLGFVVVSRPVRQGRLRLGLEEVLDMDVEVEAAEPGGPDPTAAAECVSPDHGATAAAAIAAGEHHAFDSRSELGSSDCLRSVPSSGSLLQAPSFRRISSAGSLAEGGAIRDEGNAARKLLLAEDNAINMKVALGILRRLGFTNVVTAPDGEAAVAAVAAAGGPASFDAILMDLHMPKKVRLLGR